MLIINGVKSKCGHQFGVTASLYTKARTEQNIVGHIDPTHYLVLLCLTHAKLMWRGKHCHKMQHTWMQMPHALKNHSKQNFWPPWLILIFSIHFWKRGYCNIGMHCMCPLSRAKEIGPKGWRTMVLLGSDTVTKTPAHKWQARAGQLAARRHMRDVHMWTTLGYQLWPLPCTRQPAKFQLRTGREEDGGGTTTNCAVGRSCPAQQVHLCNAHRWNQHLYGQRKNEESCRDGGSIHPTKGGRACGGEKQRDTQEYCTCKKECDAKRQQEVEHNICPRGERLPGRGKAANNQWQWRWNALESEMARHNQVDCIQASQP